MTKTIHVYDRGKIMRRAHQIAREARKAKAQAAYDLDVRVIGSRIIHNKTLAAHIAATPVDFSTAMKDAWREARGEQLAPRSTALVVMGARAVAHPRRMRFARVFRLLSGVARFLGAHWIRRAA